MTNAQIVFNARIDLMKKGILGTTGNMIEVETPDGGSMMIAEPEEIHTYKAWQRLGYQVRRGEKAITDLHIWKYTTKKKPETAEDEEESKMFFTKAYFFSASQVDEIKKNVDPAEFVGKKMTIEIKPKRKRA